MDAVHRFEGTVNQFLGDGFMALFGAPLSYEDHARRAILAAFAIRKAIAPDLQFQASDIRLRTRIGLNSGAVVVGRIGDNLRMGYTAIGDTTNVAVRIQGLAEPGTILVSDAGVRTTAEYVEYQPIGLRVLKGKSEPIVLHRAVRERAHRFRSAGGMDVVLVGRQAEIQIIHRSLEQLQAGDGCVLAVLGEAGLGKSRLLDASVRRARECGLPGQRTRARG
jgi:class 3 adenylate cyclase